MIEREATAFELAAAMRAAFVHSATTGMTLTPGGVVAMVATIDGIIAAIATSDATVRALSDELLAEADLGPAHQSKAAEALRQMATELKAGAMFPSQAAERLLEVALSLDAGKPRGSATVLPFRGRGA